MYFAILPKPFRKTDTKSRSRFANHVSPADPRKKISAEAEYYCSERLFLAN